MVIIEGCVKKPLEGNPKTLQLLIDMVRDKYPKTNDRIVASLISAIFKYECNELDVYMYKNKQKRRLQILKSCSPNFHDMINMVNRYADEETFVHPCRIPEIYARRECIKLTESKGMKITTSEILTYLITKGDINVR